MPRNPGTVSSAPAARCIVNPIQEFPGVYGHILAQSSDDNVGWQHDEEEEGRRLRLQKHSDMFSERLAVLHNGGVLSRPDVIWPGEKPAATLSMPNGVETSTR